MRPDLIALIPGVIFAVLLVIAAVYDFVQRRIPNWTVIALVLLFIPTVIMGLTPATWLWCLAGFAVALLGSWALYAFGIIGAGDSKLFSAAALFMGFGNLLMLFSATAIAGGILAIGFVVARPKQAMRGLTARGRAESTSRGIPYGVAIAIGALFTAAATHFLKLPA